MSDPNNIENYKINQENLFLWMSVIEKYLDKIVDFNRYILQSHTAELANRDQQHQALTADLAARDTQIQSLSADLANRDQQIQSLHHELNEIKISKAWRFALAFRNMRYKLAPPNSPQSRLVRKNYHRIKKWVSKAKRHWHWIKYRKLVSQSGLFDPDWYLVNYLDVVQAKINPLKHYIIHGGFEGRYPGPSFDSAWYLEKYQDVQETRFNPLVHFLLFGQNEGRVPMPTETFVSVEDLGPKTQQIYEELLAVIELNKEG